jgi:CRISPR-associated protein Cas2
VTVVVLVAVPAGLRGHLTRWLLEISPGVFVGQVTARVRDHLWTRIVKYTGETGRAIMVHTADTEQGLAFRSVGGPWQPVDWDGLKLVLRSLT